MKLEASAELSIAKYSIGEENQPLFVVDNLLCSPELLVSFAQNEGGFQEGPRDFYPGVRKPLPEAYSDFICKFVTCNLLADISDTWQQVSTTLCALSVANAAPQKLLPIQRIPHFDSCDVEQWAVVHYLCDESLGGTGFFRHRQTGFESISQDRAKKYLRVLDDEAVTHGLPPQDYLQGSSELFEMVYKQDACFNRALFYPSNLLHSGLIKNWQAKRLEEARLTANTFIRFT